MKNRITAQEEILAAAKKNGAEILHAGLHTHEYLFGIPCYAQDVLPKIMLVRVAFRRDGAVSTVARSYFRGLMAAEPGVTFFPFRNARRAILEMINSLDPFPTELMRSMAESLEVPPMDDTVDNDAAEAPTTPETREHRPMLFNNASDKRIDTVNGMALYERNLPVRVVGLRRDDDLGWLVGIRKPLAGSDVDWVAPATLNAYIREVPQRDDCRETELRS